MSAANPSAAPLHSPAMKYPILGLAFALSLAACDDSTGITAEEIACPDPQTLTYANYGAQFMSDHCTECHKSGDERPYLDTQARVQAAANQVIAEAVYHSAMPEDGSLTNAQRVELGQWLTCGAP